MAETGGTTGKNRRDRTLDICRKKYTEAVDLDAFGVGSGNCHPKLIVNLLSE